jgi:hypothetical protein
LRDWERAALAAPDFDEKGASQVLRAPIDSVHVKLCHACGKTAKKEAAPQYGTNMAANASLGTHFVHTG